MIILNALSPVQLKEVKDAFNTTDGSWKFMSKIKSNPEIYPNIYRLKDTTLLAAFNELLKIKEKKENLPVGSNKVPDFREKDEYDMDNFKTINIGNTNKGITKMKIKLSKSQWEQMGKKAGWMTKKAGKDLGQIGTISLFASNIRDAKSVGSLPFALSFSFDQIGDVQLSSNSNFASYMKNVFDQVYAAYKQQIDAAYQEGNTGFGKNLKAAPAPTTPAAAPTTPATPPTA